MSHVQALLRSTVAVSKNGISSNNYARICRGFITTSAARRLSTGRYHYYTTSLSSSSSLSLSSILIGIVSSSSLLVVTNNNNNNNNLATTLCEGNNSNNNFFDTITKKDKNGNTDWTTTLSQVTDNDFWDKIASATGEKIQGAYDTGIPSQLSYGFVCGYCSGYALKVVGRSAAVVFGLGFMGLQTLSYYGYLKVDHGKLKSDFEKVLDLNQDGKVDSEDAKIATNKLMEVLQYSLPAGGGFGGGFIAGIRSK